MPSVRSYPFPFIRLGCIRGPWFCLSGHAEFFLEIGGIITYTVGSFVVAISCGNLSRDRAGNQCKRMTQFPAGNCILEYCEEFKKTKLSQSYRC